MKERERPPHLARRLLRRALPRDVRDDVAADVDEMYERRAELRGRSRARVWYGVQVLAFAVRFLWERVRHRGALPRVDARGKGVKFGVSALDWKLGARMLVKFPGLSIIGGVALAAAIGLAAGVFELVRQELQPKLPLDEGGRVVRIANWDTEALQDETRSLYDFERWREEIESLTGVGAYLTLERNLITEDGNARPVRVAEISASAFAVARVPALLGRPLLESDEKPGAPDVAVLGHDLWQRRFGGDPAVVGRTIRLGRSTATVVGVMPEGFAFPRSQELWLPLRVADAAPLTGPGIGIFARLADGATLERAQAELTALGERIAREHPRTHARLRPRVLPFGVDSRPGGIPFELLVIYVGAFAVVCAAAANVATLVFARTAMRESEIVVRSALGASRGRVMTQLFVEALVLALAAAAVGLLALHFVLQFIWHQAVTVRQVPQPFWWDSTLEPETVLFSVGVAILGAVLVGLLPAIKATGPSVQRGLTRMASGGADLRFGGVWSVIIVLQVALTVLCLPIGIGVTRETLRDHQVRSAFPSADWLTFRLELDRDGPLSVAAPDHANRLERVFGELERTLAARPGVTAVTFADGLPGMAHPLTWIEAQRGTEPPFMVRANTEGMVRTSQVDVDFFDVFRVPIRAGRSFRQEDIGAGVVVINESLARNIGGSALDVHIRRAAIRDGEEPGPWYRVVGVARNLGMDATEAGDADFMFVPAAASQPDPLMVGVRVAGDPAALMTELPALALGLDAGLRLYDVLPLGEVVRRRDLPQIVASIAMTFVVILAIILSAAGLFALMSVAVARRTREIGIRLALGASVRGILSAVFARAATQLGVGIFVGNVLVLLLVSRLSEDVRPQVGLPMLGVSLLMALIGAIACFVPARRALRVQPTEAVKQVV